jgi:hypothetical protein
MGLKTNTLALLVLTLSVGPIAAQEGNTFRNTEFKFRFVYPTDWTAKTPRGPNVRALIAAPGAQMTCCNIVVRRMPQLEKSSRKEIIADSFSGTWSEDAWREVMPGFTDTGIRERRLTKVSNYPAQFAITEGPYTTIAATVHMVMMQFVTMTPGVFWHFSCGAGGLTSSEANMRFEKMRPQFLGILSSFVFEDAFY